MQDEIAAALVHALKDTVGVGVWTLSIHAYIKSQHTTVSAWPPRKFGRGDREADSNAPATTFRRHAIQTDLSSRKREATARTVRRKR